MANWINLFEKYRIDRRLLELHREELAPLSPNAPRRPSLEASVHRLEHDVHAAERVLARYGEGADSARDALRRADERLFLAYHYIRGLTMEDTALKMCLSRDSVYRIRRRIIARGEIPAEYLTEAEFSAADTADDHPSEPRSNILAACFAGAPSGVTDSLLAACR